MKSLKWAVAAAAIAFAASVVGTLIQLAFSDPVISDAKAAVGSVLGLFTLLLALVLGLLIWTSFSIYTTQQSESQSLGPLVAKLDATMAEYGPEGAGGRAGLIAALERARVRFFGDRTRGPTGYAFEEIRSTEAGMDAYFDSLEPKTDRQRRLLDSARGLAHQIAETQMLMARQVDNPLPDFLLVIVVLWASALFFGNGLVTKANLIVIGAYLAGSAAVGSAIFLIFELSSPYTGVFRLSCVELDRVVRTMKAEEKA